MIKKIIIICILLIIILLFVRPKYKLGMIPENPKMEKIICKQLEKNELTEEDLPKIEKKMAALVASGEKIKRYEVSKEKALELFIDDVYKTELINELPEDSVITVYEQGSYRDLCRGPHVASVKFLKNFKLLACSGAYWRGDSNNTMLQRVYGTCFATEEELKEHLHNLEERKKRDHRRLGKELDFFTPGSYPKNTVFVIICGTFKLRRIPCKTKNSGLFPS